MTNKQIGVGIGVIIINTQNKILLGQRNKTAAREIGKLKNDWDWSLPGGTLEFGESFEECAIREVKEETNLDVKKVEILGADNCIDEIAHWVTIETLAKDWTGEPMVTEPDKFTRWCWFSFDKLPDNIFFPSLMTINRLKSMRKK